MNKTLDTVKARWQFSLDFIIFALKALFVVAWLAFGAVGWPLYWLHWLITGRVPMPGWMRNGLKELEGSADMGMM